MTPLVSIVIPIVRNDKSIAECLDHIKKSTYKNYEIIVVDEGLERSAQRNIGIKRAKGEFILWLDSDMMIMPELIGECVSLCSIGFDAIYIPERIVTKGFFGYLRDWERQFYNGSLVDVVRFARREGFPLFDETLHGVEDSDWERRLPTNWKKTTSKYSFNHHDKVSFFKYLKKKAYYAQCLGKYKQKNPHDRLLTFKYRCFDVFVENGKWKRLLQRPDLALLVTGLLFLRGIIMKWQSWRYK